MGLSLQNQRINYVSLSWWPDVENKPTDSLRAFLAAGLQGVVSSPAGFCPGFCRDQRMAVWWDLKKGTLDSQNTLTNTHSAPEMWVWKGNTGSQKWTVMLGSQGYIPKPGSHSVDWERVCCWANRGAACKNTWCQARQPEFEPQNLHVRRGELTPQSCTLTYTHTYTQWNTHTHTQK